MPFWLGFQKGIAQRIDEHLQLGVFDFQGGRLSVREYLGSLANPAGTLAPGAPHGTTHIQDDYQPGAAAVLEIELFGAGAGQFDRLIVDGEADLAGTLQVLFATGYHPTAGDTFDVIDWGTIAAGFDAIAMPPGWSCDNTQLYQTGQITLVPEPGSLLLLCTGAVGLLFYGRRRRR